MSLKLDMLKSTQTGLICSLFAGACLLGGPPAAAEGVNHTIQVVSDYDHLRMYFEPKLLHIEPGDTVTWVNQANEEHDIVSFPDGYPEGATPLHSPLMDHAGQTWSYRFVIEGTYEYHCLPHLPKGMHGVVEVGRPSRNDEFHRPSAAELADYAHQLQEWFDDEVIFRPRRQRDPAVSEAHRHPPD